MPGRVVGSGLPAAGDHVDDAEASRRAGSPTTTGGLSARTTETSGTFRSLRVYDWIAPAASLKRSATWR